MANVIAEATVRVRPDTRGFESETKSSLVGSLKRVAIVAGGAFAGARIFGSILDDMEQFDANARQTAAVLKSTGGAANVSAGHVRGLANQIEAYSSIDDQAVTASENLLLTFRNIRNEAGKGNAIFDQTTKAIANVSVGMKEDLQSATIQVGKALNDPVRGMTALQRIGVTFSEHQREVIKRLVESGDRMKAQKIILGELNKEFGGSARAMGGSLQGQITLLKDQMADWARDLGLKLIPAMISLIGWLRSLGPILGRVQGFIQRNAELLGALAAGLGAGVVAWGAYQAALKLQVFWTNAVAAAQRILNVTMLGMPVIAIAAAIAAIVASLIYLYRNNETARRIMQEAWARIQEYVSTATRVIREVISTFVGWSGAFWARWGDAITRTTKAVWNVISTIVTVQLRIIRDVINIALDLIHGRWGKAWDGIKQLAADAIRGAVAIVKAILVNFVPLAVELARNIGSAIIRGVTTELRALPGQVKTMLEHIGRAVVELADFLVRKGGDIAHDIIKGVIDGLKGLPGAVLDKIKSGVDWVKDKLGISSPSSYFADHLGRPIGEGIVSGAVGAIRSGLASRLTHEVKRAQRVTGSAARGANQMLGLRMMLASGWPMTQWGALQALWNRESGWSQFAYNRSSGAQGIPQFLPMPGRPTPRGFPDNPPVNAAAQIRWGLSYIRGRYGSPSAAWAHSQRYGWYERGGVVPGTGPQPAIVHGGEAWFTPAERDRFGGGLTRLAQSVDRLVGKLDDQASLQISAVVFQTDARSFDALRRDALNRVALGVAR